jgi:hypothetical protein
MIHRKSDTNPADTELFSSKIPTPFGRRAFLAAHGEHFWLLKSGVVRTLTYQDDGTTVALGIWNEDAFREV